MQAEGAKTPTRLPPDCDTPPVRHQGPDLTAGQRAQVKVPGQRTRESTLDTSPPANRSAAVSPMGGAAHQDHGRAPGLALRACPRDAPEPPSTANERHQQQP